MAGLISGTGVVDPWLVTPAERAKFEQQFVMLEPVNGFVTGEQAKRFLLQSQLPSLVLANIWTLADTNQDGKMDRNEFLIAMKLIQMKLKGFEVPQVLPPSLKAIVAVSSAPFNVPIPGLMGMSSTVPFVPSMPFDLPPATNGTGFPSQPQTAGPKVFPIGSQISARSASPIETLVQRSSSVASQESPTSGTAGSPMQEWAVPHASKLKYTQIFNTNDRLHTGYLSGPQARPILSQTGLHNTVLAKIWALADIDGDGRLTCEEFCVAMHLAEGARAGDVLPATLPLELVPPSFRKKRSSSLTAGVTPAASVTAGSASALSAMLLGDLLSNDLNEEEKNKQLATFEDKRRENFEKGQAELEKRRQALLENQRKEQEERERKEREEMEHRERLRQEQERRRQMELEKQLAKQREIEQEKEEQRKKAMEQREAARREMERQRQLEWEKQRRQELLTQRLKEQEKVLQLKAQNQNLTMQLEQLTDKVKELNTKIMETRVGVATVKGEIDGMRETRDAKVAEMDALTKEIKGHKDKLMILNQQKLELTDRVNVNNASDSTADTCAAVTQSFNVKRTALQSLKEKVATIEKNISLRLQDIENNNTELEELKLEVSTLVNDASGRHQIYEEMRSQLLELRKRQNLGTPATFDAPADVWNASDWPEDHAQPASKTASVNAWGSEDQSAIWGTSEPPGWNDPTWGTNYDDVWKDQSNDKAWVPDSTVQKCKVMYAFEARNSDELSIMPGDVITVLENTSSEPGWLSGQLQGRTGWFPQAYVEMIENTGTGQSAAQEGSLSPTSLTGVQETVHIVGTEMKMTLFGIQEAPESISDSGSVAEAAVVVEPQNSAFVQVPKSAVPGTASPVPGQGQAVEGLQAQALFPWRAKKENHLTFNKGDVIAVKEQQDMWWYGELDTKHGWFPKSYVRLIGGPRKSGEITPTAVTPTEIDDGPDMLPGYLESADNFYEAMYTYQSTEIGDLNFNQGDVIEVTKMEGEWWTGRFDGQEGIFPRNYVKKLEVRAVVAEVCGSQPDLIPDAAKSEDLTVPAVPPQIEEVQEQAQTKEALESPKSKAKSGKKPEIATVLAPYAATGSEQLSLQRGQLLQIRKKSPSGWWEGELQAKGKKREIGWFPASYVRLLSSSASNSARSTPDLAQPISDGVETREQVVALYAYAAQNDDELTFQKGSIISIINKDSVAWWKGECNGVVGVFPANYVEPLNSQTGTSSVRKSKRGTRSEREACIEELIRTEETYVQDMSLVHDVFRKPIKDANIMTDEEIDLIFVNLNEIIECSNKLLSDFRIRVHESRNNEVETISDIMCKNLPNMTPYIRYCSGQLKAAAFVQKKSETDNDFKRIMKECCQDKRFKQSMPLSTYLLKPMQRITKYPLFLEKILKQTPVTHSDYNGLKRALQMSHDICNKVNDGAKDCENTNRLEWVQKHVNCDNLLDEIKFNSPTNCLGNRKFLHVGSLYKAKSNKELVAFLFNDFLMLTQPTKPLANSNIHTFEKCHNMYFRLYRQPLFLNEIMTVEAPEVDSCIFSVNHIKKIFTFRTSSNTAQKDWVTRLQAASKDYLMTEKMNRKKPSTVLLQRKPAVGRLLVIIMDGINLKANLNARESLDPKGRLKVTIVEAENLLAKKLKGRVARYCEVSMGSQVHKTKVVDLANPKWNASMQFIIKAPDEDLLSIMVYDKDYFSPDGFLGKRDIEMVPIINECKSTDGPITKTLKLNGVETGEIVVKLDIQMFEA